MDMGLREDRLRLAELQADPDTGMIKAGHICKHGIRWPHQCQPCSELAWERQQLERDFAIKVEKPEPDFEVSVDAGKYKVVSYKDGTLLAFRYGEGWRDCTGDKLVYCLASELEQARK